MADLVDPADQALLVIEILARRAGDWLHAEPSDKAHALAPRPSKHMTPRPRQWGGMHRALARGSSTPPKCSRACCRGRVLDGAALGVLGCWNVPHRDALRLPCRSWCIRVRCLRRRTWRTCQWLHPRRHRMRGFIQCEGTYNADAQCTACQRGLRAPHATPQSFLTAARNPTSWGRTDSTGAGHTGPPMHEHGGAQAVQLPDLLAWSKGQST